MRQNEHERARGFRTSWVGGKRGHRAAHSVTHSPFRGEFKIGQACDDHDVDAAIYYSGQDLPQDGRPEAVVAINKDAAITALGPRYTPRRVDRGFDV